MQIIDCSTESWRTALQNRGPRRDPDLEATVSIIIADVFARGDDALLEIGRRFDSPGLRSIRVTASEIEESLVEPRQEQALRSAFARILDFHRNQVEVFTAGMQGAATGWSWQMQNAKIGQRFRPLKSAGLYVPGGRASYPSSVLMLAGPAVAAGVGKLAVTTPSMIDGSLPPSVLFALKVAGVDTAFKIGGAAAVAAFAFGTESVPKVEKVAGPGNKYVNEAKRQLWGSVGVDGQYGPSEVCVVIDETTNLDFAAADLLTQLEHAPDNLGFLVGVGIPSWDPMESVIRRQVEQAPRKEILLACLANVRAFRTDGMSQAAEIINLIAPEHLSLCIEDPIPLADLVENAGCILIGEWTPESVADYCLGPSHCLPTNAAAIFAGPLSSMDFLKIQSFGMLRESETTELINTVAAISEMEGLPAHGFGALSRRKLH